MPMPFSRISAKITLLLAFLLLLFPSLVLYNTYRDTKRSLSEQMAQRLRLALHFDLAIRNYVGETIRPEMEGLVGPDRFIVETMSTSFVARSIFDQVVKEFPDMVLKFSSRHPRNPRNLAGAAEEEVLGFFETHPEANSWQGEINLNGEQYLALFAPRRMKPPCMQCHSDPARAPAELVARYGKEAGFSYQLGEVVATDTVAVSTGRASEQLRRQTGKGVAIMTIAVLGIFSGVFWGLKALVLNRVSGISNHFNAVANQQDLARVKEMEVTGHDEIDEMVRSFNALARRLTSFSLAREEEARERSRINDLLSIEIAERRTAEDNLHTFFGQQEEIIRQRTEEIASQHAKLQEAHEVLKNTQSQLLQREKMASIGQLAAGVAHEINNPVGFIHSNLTTLAKYVGRFEEFMAAQRAVVDQAPESERQQLAAKAKALKIDYITNDAKALIRECLEGTDRVKEITMNLKNFSRVDHQEQQAANLNTCLEETLRIVWNELKYKVTVVREYGDLPETFCYPQQLNQVFMNILVNAAQAIVDKGEIRLRTWAAEGVISVAISDTGPGIPAGIRHRLFEPFFTTKEVGKGTGLGLSISYEIVKRHGGEIVIDSEEGRGTTFLIQLPLRTQADLTTKEVTA